MFRHPRHKGADYRRCRQQVRDEGAVPHLATLIAVSEQRHVFAIQGPGDRVLASPSQRVAIDAPHDICALFDHLKSTFCLVEAQPTWATPGHGGLGQIGTLVGPGGAIAQRLRGAFLVGAHHGHQGHDKVRGVPVEAVDRVGPLVHQSHDGDTCLDDLQEQTLRGEHAIAAEAIEALDKQVTALRHEAEFDCVEEGPQPTFTCISAVEGGDTQVSER